MKSTLEEWTWNDFLIKAEKAGMLLTDELPKAAHDIIKAGLIQFSLLFIVAMACILLCLIFSTVLWRNLRKVNAKPPLGEAKGGGYDELLIFLIAITGVAGLILAPISMYWLLVCEYAPRYYILQSIGIIK